MGLNIGDKIVLVGKGNYESPGLGNTGNILRFYDATGGRAASIYWDVLDYESNVLVKDVELKQDEIPDIDDDELSCLISGTF